MKYVQTTEAFILTTIYADPDPQHRVQVTIKTRFIGVFITKCK
jgi:hypothetical protein